MKEKDSYYYGYCRCCNKELTYVDSVVDETLDFCRVCFGVSMQCLGDIIDEDQTKGV